MKGVLACLALLTALTLPCRASETEVGAGILVVNGTHTEQKGDRADANLIPAPLLDVRHRFGRFVFEATVIPPERAPIGANSLGLASTQLSYLDLALRFAVSRQTRIGLGEMLYNQESLYSYRYGLLPIPGAYVTGIRETDRSRIVGAELSVQQLLRASLKSTLTGSVAIAPRLYGSLGVSSKFDWSDGTTTGGKWFATPEFGSQIDVIVQNEVRANKRTTFHYGLRYLNMSMHFANGGLADRNAFLVPFFGWSTRLGR